MADQVFNPVAGVPFSGGTRMVDCGDGTWAQVSMGISGLLPVLSLSAVSAAGPGAILNNAGVRNNHSVVVNTNGTVTGGTVQLQGSQDNVNWVNLLTTALAPLSATAAVTAGTSQLTPFRYVRAIVVAPITGGGTITAYVASA
jgi:hypothetical protein